MGLRERLLNQKGGERPYKEVKNWRERGARRCARRKGGRERLRKKKKEGYASREGTRREGWMGWDRR